MDGIDDVFLQFKQGKRVVLPPDEITIVRDMDGNIIAYIWEPKNA